MNAQRELKVRYCFTVTSIESLITTCIVALETKDLEKINRNKKTGQIITLQSLDLNCKSSKYLVGVGIPSLDLLERTQCSDSNYTIVAISIDRLKHST